VTEHPEQERPEDAEAQQGLTEQGNEQETDTEGHGLRHAGLAGEDEENPEEPDAEGHIRRY
jgi:hypothetical protein